VLEITCPCIVKVETVSDGDVHHQVNSGEKLNIPDYHFLPLETTKGNLKRPKTSRPRCRLRQSRSCITPGIETHGREVPETRVPDLKTGEATRLLALPAGV
jgi:hypothetical protein